MEYQVLSGVNYEFFNNHITEALADGWELAGGVSVLHVDGEIIFYQAVVKKQ